MRALLIDFESTGLDTNTDRIIEIGCQLVDESWAVQSELSMLVREPDYPALNSEVQRVTKITPELLHAEGKPMQAMIDGMLSVSREPLDFVVAFNRVFDENLFKSEMQRGGFGLAPHINSLLSTPWICAMVDLESNYMYKSWKLSHLALEYGVAVNPKELHRAINDVDLMRKMLSAAGTSLEDMYAFQQTPWIYVQALIPAPWTDNGAGKAHAVKAGYSWERPKGDDKVFEKSWVKRIKQSKFEDEVRQCVFKIREIK